MRTVHLIGFAVAVALLTVIGCKTVAPRVGVEERRITNNSDDDIVVYLRPADDMDSKPIRVVVKPHSTSAIFRLSSGLFSFTIRKFVGGQEVDDDGFVTTVHPGVLVILIRWK